MPSKSGQTHKILPALVDPVTRSIESTVKDLGYDLAEIGPVVDRAIKRALEELQEDGDSDSITPRLLRTLLETRALDYLYLVLSQSEKIKSIRDRIKAYSAIMVVGAGISFETGVPLASSLTEILRFCHSRSYGGLRSDENKCFKFKVKFRDVCETKNVGPSHRVIAKAFPTRIFEVICLNWDNLIERASKEMGKALPKINEESQSAGSKGFLWKFHGDVENVKKDNKKGKGGWIFPDEGGYVFDNFKKYLRDSGIDKRIFTVLIVGYSENDQKVSEQVISLLEAKPPRPTYRVTLDLKHIQDENYIVGPSDFILPRIMPQ